MYLILFEPEIPQNAGTLARLCRCLGLNLGIIEPASFFLTDRLFKRAGMDYVDIDKISRYKSFDEIKQTDKNSRIILLDTKATTKYYDIKYRPTDIVLVGKESSGVPDYVYRKCDIPVKIPMVNGVRSLNMAISASIVISEAMRQMNYKFS